MNRAYKEGMSAALDDNKTEFDNPYAEGTREYNEWYKGFCKKREELRGRD